LWSNRWNENWQAKPKYSKKTCPSATLSTTKPTTNLLSYGTAKGYLTRKLSSLETGRRRLWITGKLNQDFILTSKAWEVVNHGKKHRVFSLVTVLNKNCVGLDSSHTPFLRRQLDSAVVERFRSIKRDVMFTCNVTYV
jgi:hypothetical protein